MAQLVCVWRQDSTSDFQNVQKVAMNVQIHGRENEKEGGYSTGFDHAFVNL